MGCELLEIGNGSLRHTNIAKAGKRSAAAYKNSMRLNVLKNNQNLRRQVIQCAARMELNVNNMEIPHPPKDMASLLLLDSHLTALRDVLESDRYQVALVPRDQRLEWGHFRRSVESLSDSPSTVLLPFSWTELVARVCEMVWDSGVSASRNVAQFEDICVDFTRMEVSRSSGELIPMTAQEFKTLKCFLLNPDRVFSRDELLNEAWGYEHYPSTRTVDNHVFRLRRKFEKDPTRPVHFRTVHAIGYKFVP